MKVQQFIRYQFTYRWKLTWFLLGFLAGVVVGQIHAYQKQEAEVKIDLYIEPQDTPRFIPKDGHIEMMRR